MYGNKNLVLSIFWIVLGVILTALSIAEVLEPSTYSGFGGALIGVGALQVIKNLKYRNNPEYKEEIDTQTNDERNKYIRMKSWSWTGYILVLGSGICSVIAMIFGNHELQMYLSYTVCVIITVYWVTYIIMNKKY